MSATIECSKHCTTLDPIWHALRQDATVLLQKEPILASLIYESVLSHETLESALHFQITQKLSNQHLCDLHLRDLCREAYQECPMLLCAARSDLAAVYERDPACNSYLEPLLFFKGYLALQIQRLTHWLWNKNRKELAQLIQMYCSERFGVDIHPGAKLGRGLMLDHATGVVMGETTVVGDHVSMLHGITLGGTGKDSGDRHPKIGNCVLIGAGASILGNITIGDCSKIGAGSVVLHPVPARKTVAGVPAKIVGEAGCPQPSISMNHCLPE